MSVVLAIEPDSGQADSLRQIVRDQLEVELVVVTSAYAAIVAMNRQVPDLLLFGRSVAQRHQTTVLKHLRSLTEGEVPQVLTIPALGAAEQAPQKQKGSRFGFGWGRQTSAEAPGPGDFVQQIAAALSGRTGSTRTAPAANRRGARRDVPAPLPPVQAAAPEPPEIGESESAPAAAVLDDFDGAASQL